MSFPEKFRYLFPRFFWSAFILWIVYPFLSFWIVSSFESIYFAKRSIFAFVTVALFFVLFFFLIKPRMSILRGFEGLSGRQFGAYLFAVMILLILPLSSAEKYVDVLMGRFEKVSSPAAINVKDPADYYEIDQYIFYGKHPGRYFPSRESTNKKVECYVTMPLLASVSDSTLGISKVWVATKLSTYLPRNPSAQEEKVAEVELRSWIPLITVGNTRYFHRVRESANEKGFTKATQSSRFASYGPALFVEPMPSSIEDTRTARLLTALRNFLISLSVWVVLIFLHPAEEL